MPPADPDATPPEGFPAEEPVTMVPCIACGGEFQRLHETQTGHRMSVCRYCTRGAMTAKQVATYHARTQGRAP